MPEAPYILVDSLITRRKRYHALMHPSGAALYKSRLFSEVIEAARAHDLTTVELHLPGNDVTGSPLAVLQLKDV